MKNFTKLFACLTLLFVFSVFTPAQNIAGDWMRLQSDNGEFSVDIPKYANYFYDKNGFWASKDSRNFHLEKMSLLNSFYEQTLLSFEVYEAKKDALDAFIEDDKQNGDYSEFIREGIKYKQIIKKTDEFYSVRRYFNSKKFIYVMTAGSRTGETPAARRFLNSLTFKPDTKELPNAEITTFSSLKPSAVNLETASEKDFPIQPQKQTDSSPRSETDKGKLVVFHRPRAAYVDSARMRQVQGSIKLRVTFSADGFIPKIIILKSLPENLLRQAIFAALRMKFLPKEENFKTIDATKAVEYSFAIY